MTHRCEILSLCILALIGVFPSSGSAQQDPKDVIERAAEALAASPYRFDFELARSGPDGASQLRGSAVVEPLGDGTSRYRVEAVSTEDGAPGFAAVDDGETVKVLDHEQGTFWFTPRYRAGVDLSGKFLGSLLPLALSSKSLRGSAKYRAELGQPLESQGRLCEKTVVIPLPSGAWRLSFEKGGEAPCSFELATGEGESTSRTVLEIRRFERRPAPPSFVLSAPSEVETREFTPGGPAPGEPAPALAVATAAGDWSLAAHQGKVVLIDLWATWCLPCVPSMTAIQRLLDERQGQALAAIGLNVLDSGDRQAFFSELGLSYPWAVADAFADDWGINETGIPALFVIGKDGRVIDYFLGALSEESEQRLADTVNRALTVK